MGVLSVSPGPRGVVVEGQTLAAVRPRGVVLASAHSRSDSSGSGAGYALGRVAVAFATRSHGHVGDGVEVGSEYLLVAEDFVSERVDAV